MSFVLFSSKLIGQIDIPHYEEKFGKGITTLKKKINISFFYNETSHNYNAKVNYQFDKLFIDNEDESGFIQVPFNEFQDLKLKNARYFKIDSLGAKKLIENVKVKYSDEKNFFIENIFYSDLKVKQFNCSVGLPENYIVSYSYEVIFKDLKFLNSFFFQRENEAVENVEITIKKEPNVKLSVYEFNLSEIQKIEDDIYIKFKGKDINRYELNSTSLNGTYYLPHIIISVDETNNNGKTIEILKSTDNLYDWYNSLVKELKPNQDYINDLAISIVESSTSEVEKIDKIFKWVQDNIQYVAFENGIAGFKPAEAHEVASLKYGDCKGMANLLVNLLQSQGFDAKHAWIGTRSRNYSYSIPSLVVDNHMICSLIYNNNVYFLDGTSKSALWNIPPAHLEGKQVLVDRGDSHEILTIDKSIPENNSIEIFGTINLVGSKAIIELDIKFTGHFKRSFISSEKYASLSEKKNLPYYFLYDYLDGIKIQEISNPIVSNNSISYKVSGYYMDIAINGNNKTIFPFLDVLIYDNIYENSPPIYITHPQAINVKLQIINEGKFPNEIYSKVKIGGGNFNADFFTEKVGNKYFLNQKLNFNILHSPLDDNASWNDFVSRVKVYNNYPLVYE